MSRPTISTFQLFKLFPDVERLDHRTRRSLHHPILSKGEIMIRRNYNWKSVCRVGMLWLATIEREIAEGRI